MTDTQWAALKALVQGTPPAEPLTGFIIDSPWLPAWYGCTILDYFTSDACWLEANLKVWSTFSDVLFLPGAWSEYGMCTEPSAYGARCTFWKDEFPFAHPIVSHAAGIDALPQPDPTTDGLLPFMLNRLVKARPAIEAAGHAIRFSVSRGPLNIASFLMGTTEFLTTMMLDPEATHRLLRNITEFLKRWHAVQHEAIDSIEGMMLLDDIVGFISEDDFKTFALPYLKALYDTDDAVKLFHNDADCSASVAYYPEIGINLYNPGIHCSLTSLRAKTSDRLPILGNIPPRDVLAAGTPEQVADAVKALKHEAAGFGGLVYSCGGGMPPGVPTANIRAFIEAVNDQGV